MYCRGLGVRVIASFQGQAPTTTWSSTGIALCGAAHAHGGRPGCLLHAGGSRMASSVRAHDGGRLPARSAVHSVVEGARAHLPGPRWVPAAPAARRGM